MVYKRYNYKFFHPFSFVAVFGSGIRDSGSGMGKNQDPPHYLTLDHAKVKVGVQNMIYGTVTIYQSMIDAF